MSTKKFYKKVEPIDDKKERYRQMRKRVNEKITKNRREENKKAAKKLFGSDELERLSSEFYRK